MIFSTKEILEEKVVRLLVSGEHTVVELVNRIQQEGVPYTPQAVYAVLRLLESSEVVIKRGKIYFLNKEWIQRVITGLHSPKTIEIQEGESLSYMLSSLTHNDIQWKNIVLPLHEAHKYDPIFFYNFHYIWLYLGERRKKSEIDYYAAFKQNQTHAFCLIGSRSSHDMEVKTLIQDDFVQVAVGKKLFATNDYKTVIGDYIITNSFSRSLAREIEDCYTSSPDTKTLEVRLNELGIERQKVKLKIERNKLKAKKIRKRFASEFYIPKEIVAQFDLF